MFLSKLFGKKDKANSNNITVELTMDTTVKHYETKKEIELVPHNSKFDPLVLWWISKKKKGYDITTNKFPKWFYNSYGIPFNDVANKYIADGYLTCESNIVMISDSGLKELKDKDYVAYVHEHPEYQMNISDFENCPNLHKVKLNDIAWGTFNQRILDYTVSGMWEKLKHNYYNMGNLLISEKKYKQALDYVFACCVIETSGMLDNNTLTPITTDIITHKESYYQNGMIKIDFLEIYVSYVVSPFKKIQKELNYDYSSLKDFFLNSSIASNIYNVLPFHYFDKQETFEFFYQAVSKEYDRGVFTLEQLDKPLKYNKPNQNSDRYFYNSIENRMN